ncbi:hypothetical protein BC939DRAFT_500057 [Gamsiella multidivaricata]|uniref:uncharacterized protein n=1 Tax=Gamsiella multidivaricata TaxID=101098 RepID=UPI00221EA935|nr:uncharacterized protein BC939DRAFT_500057 [Gamsiella multidivaricata]KAI7829569.1 hypothetical protein BC939DRAFT_500057 [Gamsiella multidivaricata]
MINRPDLASEVIRCLQEPVYLVANIKRSCQQLLGQFIERVATRGDCMVSDKELLDCICPHISTNGVGGGGNGDDNHDDEDKSTNMDDLDDKSGDAWLGFLSMLLRYLYSGSFSPTTATGSNELHEKLKVKRREPLSDGRSIRVNSGESAVENFVRLNQIDKNRRRPIPITPASQSFFWKSDALQKKIKEEDYVLADRKAVYQPIFNYRRWLGECKRMVLPGAIESISDIESRLPPLCGDDANFAKYVTELGNAKMQLDSFYNHSTAVKKHQWGARKARKAEYAIITNRLLKMVGGVTGRQRDEANKVVVGVSHEQFSTKSRLSLHTSFQSYFVQKARSLGYIVVGVNEYYTSKSVQLASSLSEKWRSEACTPMNENGVYPWEQAAKSQTNIGISSASSTSTSINSASDSSTSDMASGQQGTRTRKRAASVEGPATRRVVDSSVTSIGWI